MNTTIDNLQEQLAPLKTSIINHPVYQKINSIEDLRIFMRYHIYAVWDFMSLLKSLQINLTCTTLPWFPVGSGNTRSLINEIIAGEESDVDFYGNKKSHFEMYLDAMEQCGADVMEIKLFIDALQSGKSLAQSYEIAGTPIAARKFVDFTFSLINGTKNNVKAAVFTFGREDLIPGMFHTMVSGLEMRFPTQVSLFKYYLDRHIEVDGDHHSHLALEMTTELCNSEADWFEAAKASEEALKSRINLWDGVESEIDERKYRQ
jgi:hypothetical protein